MLSFNVCTNVSALVNHSLNPRFFSQPNIEKNRSPICEHRESLKQLPANDVEQRAAELHCFGQKQTQ